MPDRNTSRRPRSARPGRLLAPLVALLALAGLLHPERTAGHSFAVTRVEMEVEAADLRLILWLNPPDLLQNVLGDSLERRNFADLAHLRREARRIGAYVERHTTLAVDGRPLPPRDWGGWPPEVLPPPSPNGERDADGRLIPPALPFTLRYRLPEGAARLDLELSHYDGGGFVALFDVSSRRIASAYVRNDYIKAGQRLAFDLTDAGLGEPPGVRSEATRRDGAPPRESAPPAASRPGSASGRAEGAGSIVPPAAAIERQPLTHTIRQFLVLGFTHILPEGVDHILFVLALALLAPRLAPLVTQVTAFTLAHSLTLALAMLNIVRLPGRVVEPLIALSIAIVALENLFRRGVTPTRWLLVFGFGLIHGLGFAGVLTELGVPEGRFLPALIGFNLGVELGQLGVLALAGLVIVPLRTRRWYHGRVVVPASVAMAVVGLFWAVERVLGAG